MTTKFLCIECGEPVNEPNDVYCDHCLTTQQESLLGFYEEYTEPAAQARFNVNSITVYGPFSSKNSPTCKHCGQSHLEKPGYESLANYTDENYQGYYSHQACEQKARRQNKKQAA